MHFASDPHPLRIDVPIPFDLPILRIRLAPGNTWVELVPAGSGSLTVG